MNRKLRLASLAVATLTLAGCASTTPTVEVTQGYAVFDVKPRQLLTNAQVADALRSALQKNMTSVQVTSGLPLCGRKGERRDGRHHDGPGRH